MQARARRLACIIYREEVGMRDRVRDARNSHSEDVRRRDVIEIISARLRRERGIYGA